MATIANALASSAAGSAATPPSSTPATAGTQVNEQQFLKLLVAQLQNQNPLSPMDGTQFVSQLAQFSELEQMIGVNQGVQQLVHGVTGSGPDPNGSNGNSNAGTPAP